VFQDDVLASLLREAVANNQDLAIAVARVAAARASAGVARADLFPHLEAQLDATRTRSSREVVSFGESTRWDYRAAIAASWELDLWGRLRRGHEAALAEYAASEEGRRAALVTLVGDVAEAYFDLRELDLELEITRETTETRRKTSELFARRLEQGVSSDLETAQASADLAAASAAVHEVERRLGQQEHLLSFLLGRNPGPVARGSAIGSVALPPDVPAGLPASLLERRPDVRAAEAEVVAANARVGVARAEFFPRVSLTGLLGLESDDLNDLLDENAKMGSGAASLVAPLFQGGRLRANERVAVARWQEAVAEYRKAAQSAFRDVADQLVAIRRLRESRVEMERLVAALRQSVSLSTSRYENGLSSYFEVLDAQRRLLPAQIELARTKRDQYVALVRLYRALGGGWQAPCPPVR
jgi:multidrug efflux system outer membrane protein